MKRATGSQKKALNAVKMQNDERSHIINSRIGIEEMSYFENIFSVRL